MSALDKRSARALMEAIEEQLWAHGRVEKAPWAVEVPADPAAAPLEAGEAHEGEATGHDDVAAPARADGTG